MLRVRVSVYGFVFMIIIIIIIIIIIVSNNNIEKHEIIFKKDMGRLKLSLMGILYPCR